MALGEKVWKQVRQKNATAEAVPRSRCSTKHLSSFKLEIHSRLPAGHRHEHHCTVAEGAQTVKDRPVTQAALPAFLVAIKP